MRKHFKSHYLYVFLLLSFCVVALAHPLHMTNALVFISYLGLFGYKLYLDSKIKPDPSDQFKRELDLLKQQMVVMKTAQNIKSHEKAPYKF